MSDQTLTYQPLDDLRSEIRLLTVKSASGANSGLECDLDHVSFEALPSYHALSYCWGDPKNTRTITVNGARFKATANLHDALTHLYVKSIRTLWVDAICINQSDLEEKAKQVALMGSIYKKASQVQAWMGPENVESAQVIDAIMQYSEPATELEASEVRQTDLKPLINFLNRDYWGRVWIIQEVVFARSLTLHLGQRTIEWKKLADALARIMKEVEVVPNELTSLENLDSLVGLRQEVAENPIPLMRALRQTWRAKATEPRDKVYGLLSMVFDQRDYVSAPSYRASLGDLNKSMVLDFIAIRRSLNVVALLGRGCEKAIVKGAPSWCPDFFNINGDELCRQLMLLTPDEKRAWGRSKLFNRKWSAAGDSVATPPHLNGALVCAAMSLGSIAMAGRSIADQMTVQGLGSPFGSSEGLPRPYSEGNMFEVLYETLLWGSDNQRGFWWAYGGIYRTEVLRIWRSSKYLAGFGAQTQAWIEEHRSFSIQGRTIQEWCQHESWSYKGMKLRGSTAAARKDRLFALVKHFVVPDLTKVIALGMRLMVTTQGHIGWAPRGAQDGDLFYILRGCDVPVTLRRRPGGGFVLVGDAFIHGAMQGQMMTGQHDWSQEVEIY